MKIKRYKKDVVIKNSRKIGKFFYGLIFVVLIAIFAIIAISTIKLPGNYKLLVVESGSMQPAISQGSVIVIKQQDNYSKNDVITALDSPVSKVSVTHRIVGITNTGKFTIYTTKGDANQTADTETRLKQNVIGKVLFSIPFVGFFVNFAKTKEGLILLVVVPVTLIIYSEILNIKNEVKNLLNLRKRKKQLDQKKFREEIEKRLMSLEKNVIQI